MTLSDPAASILVTKLLLWFVCFLSCFISSYPFECPVHPDALHPPFADVVSSSCATPALVAAPTTLCYSGEPLCRQMAGCRPARREPANLPAGIAAKRGQDGCWGREGIDGWSPPRLGCSGRGNHAQESGQSVPDAGQPCTPNPSKQPESHGLQDKKGDGRCSTQCVGDSPVERRGGAGYVGVFCAGSGGR